MKTDFERIKTTPKNSKGPLGRILDELVRGFALCAHGQHASEHTLKMIETIREDGHDTEHTGE